MMLLSKLAAFVTRYPNWSRLRAGHIRHDHQPALIATRGPKEDEFDPQACAEDLLVELQHHCDQFDSQQRYQVVLTDEEDELLGQHMLTLSSHRSTSLSPVSSAPMLSDDPDMMRLALRQASDSQQHVENCIKLMFRIFQATMGQMGNQLIRLNDRCQELEGRHWQTLELAETVLTGQHKRELEGAEAKRKAQFQEQFAGRLMEMVPYVIGKISGATPVAELLQTIEPEKLDLLIASLNPHQQMMFAKLVGLADRAELAEKILAGQAHPDAANPPPEATAQEQPAQAAPKQAGPEGGKTVQGELFPGSAQRS